MPTHYLPPCPVEGIIVRRIEGEADWWRVTEYGRETRTYRCLAGHADSIVYSWRRMRDMQNRRAQWSEQSTDLGDGIRVEATAIPVPQSRSERIEDLCATMFYASVFAASRGDRARVDLLDDRIREVRATEDARPYEYVGNDADALV